MTIATKYLTATGQITEWVFLSTMEELFLNASALPPELGMIGGEWSAETHYVTGGAGVERPALTLPASHELAVDQDWSIAGVPAGSAVFVDGAQIGTVDETGLEVAFDTAGVWTLLIEPPFPWLSATCEVTVT